MKLLITGGAGFIGSHLTDRLLSDGHEVTVVDDLSLGKIENLSQHKDNHKFLFRKQDLLDFEALYNVFDGLDYNAVFHLAANSDINEGTKNTRLDLEKNLLTTYNLLECMALHEVKEIIFASTSAIFGEATGRVDEKYGPLQPISLYGASKLAAEGYITAYSSLHDIKAWITRFPNVVGERATHGVVRDFITKIRKNPKELEVLGDGKQEKPYIYVHELIDAILFVWKNSTDKINVFNLGCESTTKVSEIAEIVIREMGETPEIKYVGGKRGWKGDVPKFQYNLDKIKNLGWSPKHNSTEAVELSIKKILEDEQKK